MRELEIREQLESLEVGRIKGEQIAPLAGFRVLQGGKKYVQAIPRTLPSRLPPFYHQRLNKNRNMVLRRGHCFCLS